MNWVPLLFIDDVCHRLPSSALKPVREFSGSWSKFGSKHGAKRQEFSFRCRVSIQEVNYGFWEPDRTNLLKVTVADLNLEFDRITSVVFDSLLPMHQRVSLREFERDILPTIAPLVTNCRWQSMYKLYRESKDQNRILFNAFKNCPGFRDITVKEQGQEARDFVARQVKLGNVQTLTLLGTDRWPEAENLGETLKIFVSSARFHALISRDPLRDHYEVFEFFLERALAKELKPGAYIITAATNFDKTRLLALRPDCRHNSVKDAWQIRDSDLRIALRHRVAGILKIIMKVE